MITLSILISTVPRRVANGTFSTLVSHLWEMCHNHPDVEILSLYDNKQRTVGDKRNDLLNLARGKFLTFIDDDDWVTDDYLDSILPVLRERGEDSLDVVVFGQLVTIDDGPPKRCFYGVEYSYHETPDLWTGKPAHTMVWRSSLAKPNLFPASNYHEDIDWCVGMAERVRFDRQHRIDKILYHYRFNNATTETRG